ncbi:MAG TPA: hypothetical protein VNY34_05270, partial [Solirubrobacteraceae bacterium]|nr:hypothetical protein [Solirubrobacteraceae bacterium]
RIVMGARLLPLAGYPFALELRIAYELGEAGLTVSTTATNIGQRACPYGAGQHPYLAPGRGTIDACHIEVPAATRIITDDARKLPIGREPVAGTGYDLRRRRLVGDQQLDEAFTDLGRDQDGAATAVLWGPDGARVELWVDERYPFLEIYTGDGLGAGRSRRGLAVEPMTCAPNAFQSGEGLIRLEPLESLTTRWGVRLR